MINIRRYRLWVFTASIAAAGVAGWLLHRHMLPVHTGGEQFKRIQFGMPEAKLLAIMGPPGGNFTYGAERFLIWTDESGRVVTRIEAGHVTESCYRSHPAPWSVRGTSEWRRRHINMIQFGMPEAELLAIMGPPGGNFTYGAERFLIWTDDYGRVVTRIEAGHMTGSGGSSHPAPWEIIGTTEWSYRLLQKIGVY